MDRFFIALIALVTFSVFSTSMTVFESQSNAKMFERGVSLMLDHNKGLK